jgi:hypothetical protein
MFPNIKSSVFNSTEDTHLAGYLFVFHAFKSVKLTDILTNQLQNSSIVFLNQVLTVKTRKAFKAPENQLKEVQKYDLCTIMKK